MSALLSRPVAVMVFLAFAFAYFFSALVRGSTATLSPALTAEFGLNARDLGLLAGGYFLGFSFTQLPLGAWLDHHGPKRVVLGFLAVAIAGCAAFALADSFSGLLVARVLTGVGVSACLMAPLTGYRRWLTPAAQMRANSWMLMTGSLGMVASTLPVQWLMPIVGWRPLFLALAALLALAMIIVAWKVPHWDVTPHGDAPAGYGAIWRHPYFRKMIPLGFFCYGGLLAVQTLWAVPWMVKVAGYTPLAAATGLFAVNVSMLCTFWSWGMVNPLLAKRGIDADRLLTWLVPVHLLCLLGIIIAGPRAGALALALYCVSCTVVAQAHPAVGLAFPQVLAGRALSAYNLVIFVGVFAVQWGIGLSIDGFKAMGLAEPQAFRAALLLLLVCCTGAYGWFLAGKPHNRDS